MMIILYVGVAIEDIRHYTLVGVSSGALQMCRKNKVMDHDNLPFTVNTLTILYLCTRYQITRRTDRHDINRKSVVSGS